MWQKSKDKKNLLVQILTYVLEGEPWTFKEAMNPIESLMWKEVIKS